MMMAMGEKTSKGKALKLRVMGEQNSSSLLSPDIKRGTSD